MKDKTIYVKKMFITEQIYFYAIKNKKHYSHRIENCPVSYSPHDDPLKRNNTLLLDIV